MFLLPNREVKIGENRKTGIQAKQIGERELRDRQTDRFTKANETKPVTNQEACLGTPTYLYKCETFSIHGVSYITYVSRQAS